MNLWKLVDADLAPEVLESVKILSKTLESFCSIDPPLEEPF